jgi:hypothetical protein
VVPANTNVPAAVVERFAVLLNDGLIYPAGSGAVQQATIRAQLAALGLIIRVQPIRSLFLGKRR